MASPGEKDPHPGTMDVEAARVMKVAHELLATMQQTGFSWKPLLDTHTPEDVFLALCVYGSEDFVREMLLEQEACSGLQADCRDGLSLAFAAARGHIEIVQLLLSWPQHAPRADTRAGSAVVAAAGGGYEAIVRLLLEFHTHPPRAYAQDGQALVQASFHGHEAVARLLLEWPEHAARATCQHGEALKRATASGHMDIVRLLLHHAPITSIKALEAAAKNGHMDIVMVLYQAHTTLPDNVIAIKIAVRVAAAAATRAGHGHIAAELLGLLAATCEEDLAYKVVRADAFAAELLAEEDAAKAKAAAKKGKKSKKGKGVANSEAAAVEAAAGGEVAQDVEASGHSSAAAVESDMGIAAMQATAGAAAAVQGGWPRPRAQQQQQYPTTAGVSAAAPAAAVVAAAQQQRQRRPRLDDEFFCVVCMDAERCVTLVPCGHRVLCRGCTSSVRAANDECPMCRAPIEDARQVYPTHARDPSATGYEEEPQSNGKAWKASWGAYVRAHPWWTAAWVLLACAVLVIIIVVPICTTIGCPAKKSSGKEFELGPGAPRLVLAFSDPEKLALELIPAVLHQYIAAAVLASSTLQLLDFVDEDVLQQALGYLRDEPTLALLTRDFNMSLGPSNVTSLLDGLSGDSGGLSAALQGLIDQAAAAAGGRRLLQQDIPDPFLANGSQYYLDKANITGAWGYTSGSPDVVVAVIDTGCDLNHPDLQGQLWVNAGEIPGNGIDDDGNGFIDDVHGYDFSGACTGKDATGACNACGSRPDPWGDSAADKRYYHGTHVAGIIGAARGNGVGGAGAAPRTRVMVLRVANCVDGGFAASAVFRALDYAARMGAHVVSLSFASEYQYEFGKDRTLSPAPSWHAQWTASYKTALQPLSDKGILTVAAAGNNNIDIDYVTGLGWSYLPCSVPGIANLLCIGATDVYDDKASFSSYGMTSVHIGAPGKAIMSTLYTNASSGLGHTYGALDGTSQATPVVSATAALLLSLLGAADGNYYRATEVRALILSTAHRPPGSALPFNTRSTTNAGMALWSAGRGMGDKLPTLQPVSSGSVPLGSGASFRGLAESYYAAAGSQFSSATVGAPFDSGVRADTGSSSSVFDLRAFKYTEGVVASYTANLQLNKTGLWSLRVITTADSASTFVTINGVSVPVDSATGVCVFQAAASGWFAVELRLSYPRQLSYKLQLKGPSDAAFAYYSGFVASAPTTPALPDYVLNAHLSSAWQVSYNASNVTLASLAAASPGSPFQRTTVVLVPWGASLSSMLFASEPAYAGGAVGYMRAFLRPASVALWPAAGTAFRLQCTGCQMFVDGLLVLDVYDAIITGASTTRVSACLALPGNKPHEVVVRFASSRTSVGLSLAHAACTGASVLSPTATFSPVVGTMKVTNPMVWYPEDAASSLRSAGFIGGLQCDLYRSAKDQTTLTFSAAQLTPLLKRRLPWCSSNHAETLLSTCATTLNFRLVDLWPTIDTYTSSSASFGLRCWTYWNKGLGTAELTASAGTGTTSVYLGGQQVLGGPSPARAPATTTLGSHYQLLVIDWTDVRVRSRLRVMSGGTDLAVNLATMRLPITGIADASGYDMATNAIVVGYVYGAYSRTALVDGGGDEAPPLVLNDLSGPWAWQGSPQPVACNSVDGLSRSYTYPRVVATTRTRYTQAEGYWYNPNFQSGAVTISVAEFNASSTQVTIGNVTVRNAPAFDIDSPAVTDTFEVYVPPQMNMYTNVIVKTRRWDGRTAFDFRTTSPSSAAGVWDQNQWARTIDAPTHN
ncbi:hypothetical protein FOA52_000530 [Chlamydomonas sp. UWO 241]|nr:hypothetical protein FOA52_000530 [Chlamydomonas sp. UWO 241]